MNAEQCDVDSASLVSGLTNVTLNESKFELSEVLAPVKTINTHLKHAVDKLVMATKHLLEDTEDDHVLLEIEPELKVLFEDVRKLLFALAKFRKKEFLSVSQVYRKRFVRCLDRVVDSVEIVLNNVREMRGGDDRNLNVLVGRVWGTCDVLAALPDDELIVVVELLENERVLVEDALMELQEERGQDFKDAITGLVKVAAVCLKKVAQCIKKSENLKDVLDVNCFVSNCERISPIVDNLCSTDDATELAKEAADLRDILGLVLNLVQPLDKNNAFVAFLNRALVHNYDKVMAAINKKN